MSIYKSIACVGKSERERERERERETVRARTRKTVTRITADGAPGTRGWNKISVYGAKII